MIKKFILKITLFIFPLLIFLIYAEIGLSKIPTSYSITKENFQKIEKDIEILVIGPSYSQVGIAPKYFLNYTSYNLSNSSQSMYTSCKLVEKNLEKLKKLKLVILSVDPAMSFQSGKGNLEQWREKFYYHFWDLKPEFTKPNYLWKFSIGIYEVKTILLYGVKGYYRLIDPYLKNIDSLGWKKSFSNNPIFNDKIAREIVNSHMVGLELNSRKNLRYISTLNNTLKKKKVKLILVQLPLSKYYLRALPDELIVKNKIEFDSLSYNEHIPYYSFCNDTIYKDVDFRDVNHLNYIGAEKFSNELYRIVQDLLN